MSRATIEVPARLATPRTLARTAAALQLAEAVTALFGMVVIQRFWLVAGDPRATAAHILGRPTLGWAGFASSLVAVAIHVAWALAMFDLLRPAGQRLSRFALGSMLVGCSIQAFAALLSIAPLLVLSGGRLLAGVPEDQLRTLAFAFLRLGNSAFDAYLAFFGLWCFVTGVLIFRSGFLPRPLGGLMMLAGTAWMTMLVPPFGHLVFWPFGMLAAGAGEIPLLLWLLFARVDARA